MKVRTGFVSNSSSSSFILGFDKQMDNQAKFDWLNHILDDKIKFYTNLQPDSEQIKNFYEDFTYLGTTEEYYGNKKKEYEDSIKTNTFKIECSWVDYEEVNRKNWQEFVKYLKKENYVNKHFKMSWRQHKKDAIKSCKHNIWVCEQQLKRFPNKHLYAIDFVGSGDAPDVYFERNDWVKGKTAWCDDLYCLFYENELKDINRYIIEHEGSVYEN